MKELLVKCYFRGGSDTVKIMYEIGDELSDIANKAHIELNKLGAGFNSDSIRFEWNDEDLINL